MTTRPQRPNVEFSTRFAKSYGYGFYMFDSDAPSIGSVINDDEKFVVLNLNPKNISFNRPFAAAVEPMQGGALVVEENGILTGTLSINGNTGFLPLVDRNDGKGSIVRRDTSDTTLGPLSGFQAFFELNHLFELYGYEKRRGKLSVTFHYMDFKSEQYWRIIPKAFRMTRARGFTYDYSIDAEVIEPSENTSIPQILQRLNGVGVPTFKKLPSRKLGLLQRLSETIGDFGSSIHALQPPEIVQSLSRLRDLTSNSVGILQHLSGAASRTFQNYVKVVNDVVGAFDDISTIPGIGYSLVLNLLAQASSSVQGVLFVAEKFSSGRVQLEWNDFMLESGELIDQLQAYLMTGSPAVGSSATASSLAATYAQGRGQSGFAGGSPSTGSSPDADPILGVSGLGLQVDLTRLLKSTSVRAVTVGVGDTIFSLAQKHLGSILRWPELAIINDLSAPYIVPGPHRPSGTLAYSDHIMVPTEDTSIVNVDDGGVVPQFSGTVAVVGADNELIAADIDDPEWRPWRTNQWVGYTAFQGDEQLVVVANDDRIITLSADWSTPPVLGDTYDLRYLQFDPRRPVTADVQAYGRDLMLQFKPNGKVDVVIDEAQRDLAITSGKDCLIQGLRLLSMTPLGGDPFNTGFGLAAPIGSRFTEKELLLHGYFARRAFLSDDRVAQASHVTFELDRDRLYLQADVTPKGQQTKQAFKTRVR